MKSKKKVSETDLQMAVDTLTQCRNKKVDVTLFVLCNQFQRCPSLPGNRGAFAHVASPEGGAFAILSPPPGLSITIPRGDLRSFDTRVFERQINFFIGKDEAFVKDWLVQEGLEKLVDVFQGM